MKKILLFVLDGIADRRIAELDNKTPLEFARTPHLDRLARSSSLGILLPRPDFLGASTDLTHFLFLGYSDFKYPGRTVLEAMSCGMEVNPNLLYLSALLASCNLDAKNALIKREGIELEEEEARLLFEEISLFHDGFYEFRLHHQSGRYGILVVNGPFEKGVLDTDPFKDGYPIASPKRPFLDYRDSNLADSLAKYISWSHGILSKSKINKERSLKGKPELNVVLTKWPSFMRESLPLFKELTGLKGAIVAAQSFFFGLSKLIGLDFFRLPEAETEAKVEFALLKSEEILFQKGYDFVIVNIKDADESSHEKSPQKKVETIEKIDAGFKEVFKLRITNKSESVFCLAADHPTPSTGNLIHSGEVTPLLIHSQFRMADRAKRFNEFEARNGNLPQITAGQLMPLLLNEADRIAFSGSNLSVVKRLGFYSPDEIKPL